MNGSGLVGRERQDDGEDAGVGEGDGDGDGSVIIHPQGANTSVGDASTTPRAQRVMAMAPVQGSAAGAGTTRAVLSSAPASAPGSASASATGSGRALEQVPIPQPFFTARPPTTASSSSSAAGTPSRAHGTPTSIHASGSGGGSGSLPTPHRLDPSTRLARLEAAELAAAQRTIREQTAQLRALTAQCERASARGAELQRALDAARGALRATEQDRDGWQSEAQRLDAELSSLAACVEAQRARTAHEHAALRTQVHEARLARSEVEYVALTSALEARRQAQCELVLGKNEATYQRNRALELDAHLRFVRADAAHALEQAREEAHEAIMAERAKWKARVAQARESGAGVVDGEWQKANERLEGQVEELQEKLQSKENARRSAKELADARAREIKELKAQVRVAPALTPVLRSETVSADVLLSRFPIPSQLAKATTAVPRFGGAASSSAPKIIESSSPGTYRPPAAVAGSKPSRAAARVVQSYTLDEEDSDDDGGADGRRRTAAAAASELAAIAVVKPGRAAGGANGKGRKLTPMQGASELTAPDGEYSDRLTAPPASTASTTAAVGKRKAIELEGTPSPEPKPVQKTGRAALPTKKPAAAATAAAAGGKRARAYRDDDGAETPEEASDEDDYKERKPTAAGGRKAAASSAGAGAAGKAKTSVLARAKAASRAAELDVSKTPMISRVAVAAEKENRPATAAAAKGKALSVADAPAATKAAPAKASAAGPEPKKKRKLLGNANNLGQLALGAHAEVSETERIGS